MARPKNSELIKKTLNFRPGDFEKMGEMFPDLGSSVAIRDLLAAFVDKHYVVKTTSTPLDTTDLNI